MNGKEAIIEAILKEANESAELMLSNAEENADKIIKEANCKAEELLNAEKVKAEEEAKSIVKNKITLANLDGKKKVLGAKQKAVSEVYSLLVKKLLALPKTDYLKLLDSLISKYAEKGDRVVISENAPFGVKEVEVLASVKELALQVEEDGKFEGGIVLKSGVMDKNLTFSALAEEVRSSTESEIAEKLFK